MKIKPSEILNVFSSLEPSFLISAIILVPIMYAIRAYRWDTLLRLSSITKPYSLIYKILLVGVFYGLITPGKIGEIGRAYHFKENRPIIISSIVVEKLIDIYVLLLLSTLTIFLFFIENDLLMYGVLACCIVIIAGSLFLCNTWLLSNIARLFRISGDQIKIFIDYFKLQFRPSKQIFMVISLSFLYYGVAYLLGICLLIALKTDWLDVITLPLIILMGNIPFTISGLGLRESIGALTFSIMGESAAIGFTFALFLFIFITFIPGIFGYFLAMKIDYDSDRLTVFKK